MGFARVEGDVVDERGEGDALATGGVVADLGHRDGAPHEAVREGDDAAGGGVLLVADLQVFAALPILKAYEYMNHSAENFPEATKASNEILSLPMFPELSRENLDRIVNVLFEFFGRTG